MIDFSRRTILKVTAGAAALPAMPYVARADTYPSRSVLMLVGYAPGGPTDICARLIAQWLSQRLGQQFVVENCDGAGSNIATEAAIHAPPDGYTLLLATQSNAINATLYRHLTFDYMASTVPIAGIMQAPSVLEVTPSVPIKSTEEFIAYAKANPGKLDLGTAGNGSPPHMFAELFMYMTGVKLNVIGYRGGGPALVDLLSGQVQVMFEGITSSIGYLRANKLRPLGVTSAKRSPVLPDVPPIAEQDDNLSQATKATTAASESITDWFSPRFFETEFWYMWSTTFAFQPWHSAVELKRYLLRFLLEFSRIETLAGV